MQDFDAAAIVPSTRDLLQVLATRRRSVALVGLLDDARPAEEAARLHDLNVSAFAFKEAGAPMELAARATKTVPSLCLALAKDREACLRARYFGADGACVDAALPPAEWDQLAKHVRTTRMLPLAFAKDMASAEAAITAGARAILIAEASAEALLAIARALPKNLTIVAWIEGADRAALATLAGHVDAAIVPPAVHRAPDFADLVAELDP